MSDETRTREVLRVAPITPIYTQSAPNEQIVLAECNVKVILQDGSATEWLNGAVYLQFVGSPWIAVEVNTQSLMLTKIAFESFMSWSHQECKLEFDGYGPQVPATIRSWSEDKVQFVTTMSGFQARRTSSQINHAVFHLFNAPDFSGPEDFVLDYGPQSGGGVHGRVTLALGNWSVEIVADRFTSRASRQLAGNAGYVISHAGKVTPSDGRSFSSGELDDLLLCLRSCLSFVMGRRVGLGLTVGFDSLGERVYEGWGCFNCDSGAWKGSASWFDSRHSEIIKDVSVGFYRLWRSELWSRPLRDALYWYLEANRGAYGLGADSALLFTQSAMELLAWNHCVLDRRMVSEEAFGERGGLRAADKIRLLASSLGIPVAFPPELVALQAYPGRSQPKDAVDAIVQIRNALVHPGKRDRADPSTEVYREAWLFSMWYLELALLRLCEYKGRYAKRFRRRNVGDVDPVPWLV